MYVAAAGCLMVGVLIILAAALLGLGVLFAGGPKRPVASKVVGWVLYVVAAAALILAVFG